MGRGILSLTLILLMLPTVLAAANTFGVDMLVVDADLDAREYTFQCTVPADANQLRSWTARTNDNNIQYQTQSTDELWTIILDQDDVYHVACGTLSAEGDWIEMDFHIDLTTAPFTDKPNIDVTSLGDLTIDATCTHPTATNYNLYWTWNHQSQHITPPDSTNENNIVTDAPTAGLWEISCGVWDIDNEDWSQSAVTIEFFEAGGLAYVPTADGCFPHQDCPWVSGGDEGDGTELPSSAPTWLEPTAGNTNVDPHSFKLHVNDFDDPDGDAHHATDFEIYDVDLDELVWHAPMETLNTFRIESGDGIFVNSLSGSDRLLEDTEYRTRARFISASDVNNTSDWSEWRYFETRPPLDFNDSVFDWTAREGFTIELVAENINLPTDIDTAPDLYGHLPFEDRPHVYFTQLYGQLGLLTKDGTYIEYASDLLNFPEFDTVPGAGEIGVTGLYVDETTGDLFVSMVYHDPISGILGKVERYYTNADGDGFTHKEILIDNLPSAPAHQVHKITRGPDGKLYLQTGDDDHALDSKDPTVYSGKILRFNDDGSIPVDNPFPGTYTWAAGFRNPFGGDWRPGTEELFVTNNGVDFLDGIYQATAGDVFGWCCDLTEGTWFSWGPSVAPTGLAFDTGDSVFPAEHEGTMFVVLSGKTYAEGQSITGKRIVQFGFDVDDAPIGMGELVTYTGDGFGTPISLTFADDGMYFTDIFGDVGFTGPTSSLGRIYRVLPGEQTPPEPGDEVCYDNLEFLPSSCDGGDITSDTYNGCRSIVCEDGDDSLEILACDKPGTEDPTHFEMFTISQSGSGIEICIADVCLDPEVSGFVQSPDYPICVEEPDTCVAETEVCDGIDNDCDGQIDEGDVCSGDDVCFENLALVPSSCSNDGSVIEDSYDGCRHVTCEDVSGSTEILACDKPGESNPTHFEMYLESSTSTVAVCLGEVCLYPELSGFVQSDDYPICIDEPVTCEPSEEVCDGLDNDCDDQVDEGDVCGVVCDPSHEVCDGIDNDCDEQVDEGDVCSGDEVCHESVLTMPVSCNGGDITADDIGGCRAVSCENGPNMLDILACDKNPTHFEIYLQSIVGSGLEVCFGDTCLNPELSGFAKSPDFPICLDDEEPPVCDPSPEVCDGLDNDCDDQVDEGGVCDEPSEESVSVSFAPWFPQGLNAVLLCEAEGFTPTSYFWDFGDGDTQTTAVGDVWHTFPSAGSFTVSCEASDGLVSEEGSLEAVLS